MLTQWASPRCLNLEPWQSWPPVSWVSWPTPGGSESSQRLLMHSECECQSDKNADGAAERTVAPVFDLFCLPPACHGVMVIFTGLAAAPSPRITTTLASAGPARASFGNVHCTPKSYQPRISPSISRPLTWTSTRPGCGPRPSPARRISSPGLRGLRGLQLERRRIDRQNLGRRRPCAVVGLRRLGDLSIGVDQDLQHLNGGGIAASVTPHRIDLDRQTDIDALDLRRAPSPSPARRPAPCPPPTVRRCPRTASR